MCKVDKALNEYYKATGRYLNVKSACKECIKPSKHLHYIKNQEKYKQRYQEFLERNPNYVKDYKRKKVTNKTTLTQNVP